MLKRLRDKVSVKEGGQVSRVAGISPHIQNTILCSKLLKLCGETLAEVKSLTSNIKNAVSEAYEQKAEENGHLTGEKIKRMFDEYHEQILHATDKRMKDMYMVPQVEAIETCIEVFADSVIDSTRGSNIIQ